MVVACASRWCRLDAERRAGSSRQRRRGRWVILGAVAVQLHADHVFRGVHGRIHAAVGGRLAGELDRQPRGGREPRPGAMGWVR